jgi:peroxiredoxin 2/4
MRRSTTIQKMGSQDAYRLPLIGEVAPSFQAETTQGQIRFPDDYKGK